MKRKLFLLLCTLLTMIDVQAQKDVTSTYLTNPGFDDGETGWTYQTSSGTHYHGTLAYGSSEKINGIGIVSSDKFGKSEGKAICTAAGWGTVSYYTQDVTLPAGQYKITFDVLNNRNTTGGSSRLGWVPNSGDAVYSTTEFTYQLWCTHSVSFTLTEEKSGKISIGVASVSGQGSGSCAHLYIDNVKIFKMDETPTSTIATPIDYSDLINQKTWSYNEDDGSGNASVLTGNVNKGDWPYQHAERYRGNGGHYGKKLYQTIENLPAGVYQVKASCMSAAANGVEGGSALPDGTLNNAYFYANSEETTYPLANATSSYQKQIVTLDSEGSIEFGVKTVAVGANWNAIGCATLVKVAENYSDYLADLLSTSYEELKSSIDYADGIKGSTMDAPEAAALESALNDSKAMYEGKTASSASEIESQKAALDIAIGNAEASIAKYEFYDHAVSIINGGTNVDLTSLITNPGFEAGNTNGWTNSGSITANAQNNSAFDNKQGTWYAERWHTSGTVDINQTLQYLPAGIYKIEAYMFSDTDDAKLYANDDNVKVSTSAKYSTVIEIADKGRIKIGASCTLTNSTWICLDDFKLTFVGTVDDLTYTLATGKMAPDKSAAQSAAETAFLNNKSLATYNALLAAIADAEISVANYEKLKAAIDKANGVKDANNFVTVAATTAFENEINAATTAWTNETYSDAEALAEINTLGSAVSGWHAIDDSGKAGSFMVSAWGKTHENWWSAPYINTWSTEGDNDGTGFSVPFFEWFVDNNQNLPLNTTLSATLEGLENGCYEVELWGRAQRRTDANFGDANEITMSVNDGDAVSIMNGTTIVNSGQNNEMRLGHFTARGMVTNGTLTLSIKTGNNGSNVHWLCWRDVKYTKLDEANMAVNATAQWGTFCAPFAVTIPDGVTAYTCADATNGVLNLVDVNTTIPANTPVILNAESGLVSTTFYGKKVDNESEDLIAGGLLRGNVSNSAKDIAYTGNEYLLQRKDDKTGFYKMNSANTYKVGYNRCYLVMDSNQGGNAREVFFFEDDATAISALEAAKAEDGALKDGKYLIGNKVVLVKNGVKYGASGQKLN